jgi:hypothetical protein
MASPGHMTFFTEVVSRKHLLTTKLRSVMDGKEIRNLTVVCVLYSLSRSETHRANAFANVRVAAMAIIRQAIRDRYERVRINSDDKGEL